MHDPVCTRRTRQAKEFDTTQVKLRHDTVESASKKVGRVYTTQFAQQEALTEFTRQCLHGLHGLARLTQLGRATSQRASQPVSQLASQPASLPASQPAGQPASQPASQPATPPQASQQAIQQASKPTGQAANWPDARTHTNAHTHKQQQPRTHLAALLLLG